jgi:hypothetical protein
MPTFLDELCSQGELAVWLDDAEGASRLVALSGLRPRPVGCSLRSRAIPIPAGGW